MISVLGLQRRLSFFRDSFTAYKNNTYKDRAHGNAFLSIYSTQYIIQCVKRCTLALHQQQCGILCSFKFQSFWSCYKMTCILPSVCDCNMTACISNLKFSVILKRNLNEINGCSYLYKIGLNISVIKLLLAGPSYKTRTVSILVDV